MNDVPALIEAIPGFNSFQSTHIPSFAVTYTVRENSRRNRNDANYVIGCEINRSPNTTFA